MKKYNTAERLNQYMRNNGLRQIDLLEMAKPYCEKYGVKLSKSNLSMYASGAVEPSQEKLSILSMALKVSETWLMGYEEESESQEQAFLDKFRRLDQIDRARIMERIDMLLEDDKYLEGVKRA